MEPETIRNLKIAGAVAAGVAVYAVARLAYARSSSNVGGKSGQSGALPAGVVAPKPTHGIEFAQGVSAPLWPVVSTSSKKDVVSYRGVDGKIHGNGARRFGASRGINDKGLEVFHAGLDVYGKDGDLVRATEDGEISAIYYFYHDSYAVLVCTDTGITIVYGEVKKDSWKEFGLSKGSRVKRGDPIARIGVMSGGSTMLHFETYEGCVKANKPWRGQTPPPSLRDPTLYLLRASSTIP